jgi:hypothetical protein
MTFKCAYCGKPVGRKEKEHVIPSCLYPKSKARSKVQRITVPTCRDCNASWADDEAHFRNVINVSGDANEPARELWQTTTRSFNKSDGRRRLIDLIQRLQPVKVDGRERFMIYPGKDELVIRIIRKIIRGLCHFHQVATAVDERRVWADVLKYKIPDEFLKDMPILHREADILQYRFAVLNQVDIHSVWVLTFFERTIFISIVSESIGDLNKFMNDPVKAPHKSR